MSLEIRRAKAGALICDAHHDDATHQIVAIRPGMLLERDDDAPQARQLVWLDVCPKCLSAIARHRPRPKAKRPVRKLRRQAPKGGGR